MPGLKLNSKTWREGSATRGGALDIDAPKGLPAGFLTSESAVAEEMVVTPPPAATRGEAAEPLDLSYEVAPGETAVIAIRQPSGALTFHAATEDRTRGAVATNELRFVINVPPSAARVTRGFGSRALKAMVITVAGAAADRLLSTALAELAASAERAAWQKFQLTEGWLKVTAETLKTGALVPGVPMSNDRALLLLHGTFSHAAAAFKPLASGKFFERVAPLYGDRIFAFNHFTVSKTPEENARELLDALPAAAKVQFDVLTHSRGGLVLRTVAERSDLFASAASRFTLGRGVLVASPNDGTPLATGDRWQDTVGWLANLLEILPDNPFTTGAEFVANGIVWLARHVSGDLPGLRAMDGTGADIKALQGARVARRDAYSALVSNYQPLGEVLDRLIDAGVDQFFDGANDLVVPSSGGWRVGAAENLAIPADRIGCFGPGGNLAGADVTHTGFFARPETTEFLVNSLIGLSVGVPPLDPATKLPDRRLFRGGSAPAGRRVRRDGGMSERPATTGSSRAAADTLKVTVSNGDLTFENLPLMVGHYRSIRLTGTEAAVNRIFEGTLARALDAGIYPLEPGSQKLFSTPRISEGLSTRGPAAAIVVGLGSEGKLRAEDLAMTVRQGVLAWAEAQASADGGDEGKRTGLAIAATLIGSGGTGMSAGQSARSIVQGVLDGNEVITASDGNPAWPVIEHLRIVEVYLDRASEAWRTLKMDDQAVPGRIALTEIIEAHVGGLTGEERQTQARLTSSLEWGYRGADYDFISALAQQTSGGEPEIAYTLNTKRARTEVRAQKTQGRLLKELVLHAANARNTDERIGRTLFGLLVPIEMEPFLAGRAALQLELDDNTAGFPWELLDNNDPSAYFDEAGRRRVTNSTRPWAIRSKLLRKLRTVEFRASVTDATPEASILVIGEPECPTEYPRLPAARREAHAVSECFSTTGKMPPENIRPLISPEDGVGANALTIMNALRERDWRIVHIAGHGALPSPTNGNGGIVLTNGTFLSATEIRTLRTVPELVFINCCHLGARNIDQLLYDRGKFAAGVAEELIKIGVRCVIAAGWAVNDVAASRFAVTFYRCLLDGARFIDAVAEARAAAFEEGGNTWAAYQCYGDPDWTFTGSGAQAIDNSGDEFAFIATPSALLLALNAIAVETKYRGRTQDEQRDKVKALEARFAKVWSANGALAEGFAIAYAGVSEIDKAIEWYDRALAANDGTAPIRSAEQVSNLRIRRAWRAVMQARQDKKKKGTALSDARKAITKAMSTLDATITLKPTVERLSLYGSAYKRLALLEAEARRPKEEKLAIEQMTEQYRLAAELGEQSHSPNYFYPAMNYLVGDLALNAGDAKWKGPAPGFIERVRKSFEARCNTDLDFWSMVGLIELTVYEAVAGRRLAAALPGVVEQYEALNGRIDSKWMWGSVYDTAAFVLNRYRARVKSKAEQKAVDDLLERLSQLAGG